MEALAIYETLNEEYATYKGKYKTYLAEKLEYESEEDFGNGKMLFGDVHTVYDLGDAARLYNWDAGLVPVPRSSISGKVWDDSFHETEKNTDDAAARDKAYNGIQDDGEPGLANQAVYLTQWYYLPFADLNGYQGGTGDEDATLAAFQFKRRPELLTMGAAELAAEAVAAGVPKAAVEAGDFELASDASGFWVRNLAFGTDRMTSRKVEEPVFDANGDPVIDEVTGTQKIEVKYVPRSTDGWNVLDGDGNATGVIAVKTGDVRRYTDEVTGDDGTVTEEVREDDSKLGVYTFDNLPAAYTAPDGGHYLASYRVEVGERLFTSEDDATTADDEQWLLTRYHKTAADGEDATERDSDAEGGLGKNGGIAITAQDTVLTLDGNDHDGVRAHSGHIVLADTADNVKHSNIDPDTLARDLQASKVTIPLADVVSKTIEGDESAASHTTADGTEVLVPTDRYITYDWLGCRPLRDENGDVVVDEGTRRPLPAVVPGGDAGEIKPPTQKITGVVFNDADNDGMNGTVAAGETDTVVDHPVKGVQLTLERYYTLAESNDAEDAAVAAGGWHADPTWSSDASTKAYKADRTRGLAGDNHYGAWEAPEEGEDDTWYRQVTVDGAVSYVAYTDEEIEALFPEGTSVAKVYRQDVAPAVGVAGHYTEIDLVKYANGVICPRIETETYYKQVPGADGADATYTAYAEDELLALFTDKTTEVEAFQCVREAVTDEETGDVLVAAVYAPVTLVLNEYGLPEPVTSEVDGTHNALTLADGSYEFTNLKTQGWLPFKDGVAVPDGTEGAEKKLVVFGYRVRVTEEDWWNRYWGTAKYLQGSSYAVDATDWMADSDLVHTDGYLMSGTAAEGDPSEYTVLLNVRAGDSPSVNLHKALNPNNPNQNTIDRYGENDRYEGDAVEEVLTTNAVDAANADKADDAADRVAFRPVLTYDLARGADRAGNDAGLRVPVQQKIGGRVFHDADYDGTLNRTRQMNTLPTADKPLDGDDADAGEDAPAETAGDIGMAGKRVILKQWYWAPVEQTVYKKDGVVIDEKDAFADEDKTTLADGVTAEQETVWQWVQNKAFGNDAYTVAEASVTYDGDGAVESSTDAAYADGLTTIIPNATYDEKAGGVWLLTDKDEFDTVTGADGAETEQQVKTAGDYLFDRLPARYVEARHDDIYTEPEFDNDDPILTAPSTLGAPAPEYQIGRAHV